jgi:myo-inositol-1(or 4)-monophosphatase
MPSQRASDARRAELLEASMAAARVAADYIREMTRDLGRLDWREKQSADFVSEVDTGAEERIREQLAAAVPGAAILGEELSPGGTIDSDTVFVVDPVDGTTNFLHGFPFYAVSIGATVDGIVESGVVLDVPRDEWFTATRGGGAFVNGAPLSVSRVAEPSRSLIGTGFPFKHRDLFDRYERQLGRLMRSAAGIRRAGSAALDLACVAAGRFDGFWELRLAPWDIAAGILLVREAGGRITDLSGVDLVPAHTPVVASNTLLHPWLLANLTEGGEG